VADFEPGWSRPRFPSLQASGLAAPKARETQEPWRSWEEQSRRSLSACSIPVLESAARFRPIQTSGTDRSSASSGSNTSLRAKRRSHSPSQANVMLLFPLPVFLDWLRFIDTNQLVINPASQPSQWSELTLSRPLLDEPARPLRISFIERDIKN